MPITQDWVGDWVVSGKIIHVTTATRIFQEYGTMIPATVARFIKR